MRFATEEDFTEVYGLFKKNHDLLPHARMGYVARKILGPKMASVGNEEASYSLS